MDSGYFLLQQLSAVKLRSRLLATYLLRRGNAPPTSRRRLSILHSLLQHEASKQASKQASKPAKQHSRHTTCWTCSCRQLAALVRPLTRTNDSQTPGQNRSTFFVVIHSTKCTYLPPIDSVELGWSRLRKINAQRESKYPPPSQPMLLLRRVDFSTVVEFPTSNLNRVAKLTTHNFFHHNGSSCCNHRNVFQNQYTLLFATKNTCKKPALF